MILEEVKRKLRRAAAQQPVSHEAVAHDPRLAARLVASHARMSAWMFTGFLPDSEDQLDLYEIAGLTGTIVGVNHEDDDRRGVEASDLEDDFRPIGGADLGRSRMRRALDAHWERGLMMMIMPWLRPAARYNEGLRAWLDPLTEHDAYRATMHDAERFAHKLVDIVARKERRSAQEVVARYWVPWWSETGVDQYVTDYTLAPDVIGHYLRHCTGGCPQTYPRWSWRKKGQRIYTPGAIQARGEAHWRGRLLSADQELLTAIALYDLRHPGGVLQAVNDQFDEVMAGTATGIAAWSSRSAHQIALWQFCWRVYQLRVTDLYGDHADVVA